MRLPVLVSGARMVTHVLVVANQSESISVTTVSITGIVGSCPICHGCHGSVTVPGLTTSVF